MDEGHFKNSWPSAKPVYADSKENWIERKATLSSFWKDKDCSNANLVQVWARKLMWVRYEKSSFLTRCLQSGKPKKFPHLTDAQGEKFYGELNDFKTSLSNFSLFV